MKKGAKWVLGLTGFIIVAFIILSMTGVVKLVPQSGMASGSSLISLSSVNLESVYAPLNGQAWVLTFKLGGAGSLSQYYKYVMSQDEAGKLYGGVEQPRDTFTLDVKLDEQSCVYGISQDYDLQSINSYTVVSWTYNPLLKSLESSKPVNVCGNMREVVFWAYDVPFKRQAVGICETEKAVAGRFDSPDVNSKFTVSVSRNGVVDASKSFQTLFSDGSSFDVKGLVGNNVYVNWQGDLSSGKSCPSSGAVIPVYYQGVWSPVGSANYETYRIKRVSLDTWVSGEGYKSATLIDAESRISDINSASNNALSGRNFGTIEDASKFFSAQANVVLSSAITYPVITAYVKASWIGVVTPIGKPSIVEVSSDCFSSSSDGRVKVVVKNVGSQRETFSVGGVCSNGAFRIQNGEVSLDAGESKIVYLALSGETSGAELKSSCTINVKGVQFSDSRVFTGCVKGIVVCDAGKLYCDQKNLMKCNNGGTAYGLLQVCVDTCVINSSTGLAQCKGVVPVDTCGNGVCDVGETKESCAFDCQPSCESSFFGLVPASVGVKESCDFWCKVGLKQPEQVNVCVKDYTPLIIVIVTLLILVGMLLFAKGKNMGKSRGKSSVVSGDGAIWKKAYFWIVLGVIAGVSILVGFFKYFLRALIVFVVVALVFVILFRRSFWKRIKRMIEGG